MRIFDRIAVGDNVTDANTKKILDMARQNTLGTGHRIQRYTNGVLGGALAVVEFETESAGRSFAFVHLVGKTPRFYGSVDEFVQLISTKSPERFSSQLAAFLFSQLGVASVLAIGIVSTACFMYVTGKEVPDSLKQILMLAAGFFLGSVGNKRGSQPTP